MSVGGDMIGRTGTWIEEFHVYDSTGAAVTTLTSSSFTILVQCDGVAVSTIVTITAISGSEYTMSVSVPTKGRWYVRLTHAVYGVWAKSISIQNNEPDDLQVPRSGAGNVQVDVEEWKGSTSPQPIPNDLIFGRVDASAQEAGTSAVTAIAAASSSSSAPTVAQIAAAILRTPENLLTTDSAGNVLTPQITRVGTCQAGSTSTTAILDTGASATTSLYVDQLIVLTGGTGAGQSAWITAYNGATKTATISFEGLNGAWAVTPDATTTFALIGDTVKDVNLTSWRSVTPQALNAFGNVLVDLQQWLGGTVQALAPSGHPKVDLQRWLGVTPSAVSGAGNVKTDVEEWGGSAPAALSSGYVQADLETWKGTVPLPLASQRVDVTVGVIQNSVITAASVAAGAITSAAFAVGAITAAAIAANAIDVTKATTAFFQATADALLDRTAAVDSYTPRMILRGLGMLLGKTTGNGANVLAADGSKVRAQVVYDPVTNDRTSVTLDLT